MLLLVLFATIGAWIGFANPLFHFPLMTLAFPMGLAWIGLRATSWKKAFKFGWFAGLLAASGCFYWMVIPVQYYGGLPWFIALPCPVLLAGFMSLYYGLFSVIIYHAGRRIDGVILCIMAGLCWASMEMLIGTLLSGFPWMNLASAFAPWPITIQLCSVIGAYGLSGLLVALAVAILLYSTYRSSLVFALCITAVILGFGYFSLSSFDDTPDFPVSIVQGNIDQGHKWDPAFQVDTVKTYASLSIEAVENFKPKLVVWPETAMPFYLQDQTPYRAALEILAHDTKTPLVIGSPAYRMIDMKARKYVLLNRAWLMDDTGRTTQKYDKEHLVPFGEYMPMEEWIPFDKLVQAAGDFVPGKENKPLMLDGVALGVLICYEAIFPSLAQQQVERGANALLNISNDAWFGNTSAPKQHLNLTIMRAVEQGRWLVRGTNTGISAFIDPLGRIAAVSNQFKAETLSAAIAPRNETTFYHDNFTLMGRATYGLTLMFLGWFIFGTKRKEQ